MIGAKVLPGKRVEPIRASTVETILIANSLRTIIYPDRHDKICPDALSCHFTAGLPISIPAVPKLLSRLLAGDFFHTQGLSSPVKPCSIPSLL